MKKTVDEMPIVGLALADRYNRKERRTHKGFKNVVDKVVTLNEPFPDKYNALNHFEQSWNGNFKASDGQTKVELANGTVLEGASVVISHGVLKLTLDKNAIVKMINGKITTLYFQLKLAA